MIKKRLLKSPLFARKKKLYGGIKLPGFKSLSNTSGIKALPLPPLLAIPLKQHIGEPAKPVVTVGERVLKGQVIAETSGYISAPVHASSSGFVVAIEARPIPHTADIKEPCIIIHTDGKDEWHPAIEPVAKPLKLPAAEIRRRISGAGVVGLGGAVFPSAVKLKPTREIETLLINGVECEPYITCDDVLMRYKANTIIQGALLLAKIIKPHEIVVAIEDNKPEAYQSIVNEVEKLNTAGVTAVSIVSVVQVATIFPAGGEKQLIRVITGKEVPSGSLPYEVGIVCLNVGTTAAIYDALYHGHPLVSRVMTVTGDGVRSPGNYQVLLGTPIDFVLQQVGAVNHNDTSIVMGGPMMGIAIANQSAPVVKAANCLLIKNEWQIRQPVASMPCIRCGQCASVCPMKLVPQQLYWHAHSKSFDKLANYHIDDCIECGCCQVVCPAKLPLVHYFRFAKSEIKAQERERKKADVSRLRSETRLLRLEKIRQEQEQRKARRKANRKRTSSRKDASVQNESVKSNSEASATPQKSQQSMSPGQADEQQEMQKSGSQSRAMVR